MTTTFASFFQLWRFPALLKQLAWREIASRYRGSVLGLSWPFLAPLLMLAIYSFVFGTVFQARWGLPGESTLDFALTLFAGLIVFNFFAECLGRAPGVIAAQPNLVKKVVFPLELLPLAIVLAALFHAGASTLILIAALAAQGALSASALWLPLVWLPFVLMVAGLSWILAALGVFVRDLGQAIGMATTALLFLSPVFYPASALPERLRSWLFLNPLTVPIEQSRAVLSFGEAPSVTALCVYGLLALAVAALGLALFRRVRPGFADVL